ncbi:MAG: ABC transporter ATP-binding protein [Candidatus Thermoplasmatota archaeon]|nr:ABC transporter ATP-binding protein [Candidatus Thermoplasmatota archaeon]
MKKAEERGASPKVALSVENLKLYFYTSRGAVRAVDGVSFEICCGQSLGIVGESGSGKSTVAFGIMNMPPAPGKIVSGKVTLDGVDIFKLPEEKLRKDIRWKKVSMVFQGAMNALNPVYTVKFQMTEPFIYHMGMKGNEPEVVERISKALESVGLKPEIMDRYPHELSGGMKQRVVIAMALLLNPALVICDEPTTALDVVVQAQIMNLLKELKRKTGIAFIFITHDLSIEAEIADDLCVMYAGKIVEKGSGMQVYKNPMHPYTQKLLAATPLLHKPVDRLEFIPGAPPDLINPPKGCRFAPRCQYADERCKTEEPEHMIEVEPGHFIACHSVRW